ncbi:bifunctional oligoribonuclease/PAP phosphatase NrnA [Pseudomonadota bacterium]
MNKIINELKKATRIAIISHRNPDPDTLGSNFALRYVLEELGKSVDSICIDDNPYDFSPFAKNYEIKSVLDHNKYDLIISVDCGSTGQTVFLEENPNILEESKVINIDHHATNNNYGDINLVEPDTASTTIIIYHLLKEWGIKITAEIASYLLVGIYFDTGSFMHSNTDDTVYSVAGELVSSGAAQKKIIEALYKKNTPEKFKLWGKVLSNMRITGDNIVVSGIKAQDLTDCNATSQDLSGIIDFLGTVKGNNFATLLTEDGDGNIKGSLRTRRDDVNLSQIAEKLGGGGHKKASGFSIKGNLKKVTHIKIQRNNS